MSGVCCRSLCRYYAEQDVSKFSFRSSRSKNSSHNKHADIHVFAVGGRRGGGRGRGRKEERGGKRGEGLVGGKKEEGRGGKGGGRRE